MKFIMTFLANPVSKAAYRNAVDCQSLELCSTRQALTMPGNSKTHNLWNWILSPYILTHTTTEFLLSTSANMHNSTIPFSSHKRGNINRENKL